MKNTKRAQCHKSHVAAVYRRRHAGRRGALPACSRVMHVSTARGEPQQGCRHTRQRRLHSLSGAYRAPTPRACAREAAAGPRAQAHAAHKRQRGMERSHAVHGEHTAAQQPQRHPGKAVQQDPAAGVVALQLAAERVPRPKSQQWQDKLSQRKSSRRSQEFTTMYTGCS